MKKILTFVFLALLSIATFAQTGGTSCKVKSYSRTSGVLKCANGNQFSPAPGKKTNRSDIKTGANVYVHYRIVNKGKQTTYEWESIGIEVKII